MEAWQNRVYEEATQLQDKIKKLGAFLLTDTFSQLDTKTQELMVRQYAAMSEYLGILVLRIAAFVQ